MAVRWEGDWEGLEAAVGAELLKKTLNVVADGLGFDAKRPGDVHAPLTGRQPAKDLPFSGSAAGRSGIEAVPGGRA